MSKTIFQTLKLFNMLSPIEKLVQKTKYTTKAKKKAIKILTNKRRKLNTDNEEETFSDAEIILNAEPYRDTSKKDEMYRKKARKKAIKTLTKRKPSTTKKKTIKVVEQKEDETVKANLGINPEDFLDVPLLFNLKMTDEMEIENWLVDNLAVNNDEYYIEHKQGTNVFRIRKQPDSESNNSEIVQKNLTINPEDFANLPLVFNLNMTRESEIEDCLSRNIKINTEEEYYIEHKKGSNLFIVRKPSANSNAVKANSFINPEEFLNVPCFFDLNKTSENEIENRTVKSIKYWITRKRPTGQFYIYHENGSDSFIIKKLSEAQSA